MENKDNDKETLAKIKNILDTNKKSRPKRWVYKLFGRWVIVTKETDFDDK